MQWTWAVGHITSGSLPSFVAGAYGASADHLVCHAFAIAAIDALTWVDDDVTIVTGPSFVTLAKGFCTFRMASTIFAVKTGAWIGCVLADIAKTLVARPTIPSIV